MSYQVIWPEIISNFVYSYFEWAELQSVEVIFDLDEEEWICDVQSTLPILGSVENSFSFPLWTSKEGEYLSFTLDEGTYRFYLSPDEEVEDDFDSNNWLDT